MCGAHCGVAHRKLRCNADIISSTVSDFSKYRLLVHEFVFVACGEVQKRLKLGPRSDAKGNEKCLSFPIGEEAVRCGLWCKARSRSFKYSTPWPHRNIVPTWNASRQCWVFDTVLSALYVFDLQHLTRHMRGDTYRSILPKGTVSAGCACEPIAAGQIPGGHPRPSAAATAAGHTGLTAGDAGVVIAKRYVLAD